MNTCPEDLPPEICELVTQLANAWVAHQVRPAPTESISQAWDDLISAWAENPALPLFVRKAKDNRGHLVIHRSGRALIPVDNSPAQWVYANACSGIVFDIREVSAMLDREEIPVAMIFKKSERERARHKRALGTSGTATAGWKLGHIDPVGLNAQGLIENYPIETLKVHHRLLLSPRNMFLVPLTWSGIAELPQMTKAIRTALKGSQ